MPTLFRTLEDYAEEELPEEKLEELREDMDAGQGRRVPSQDGAVKVQFRN